MMKRIDLGWATIIAALLTALLSLGMSAYIQATHDDVSNEHRITTVEQKVDGQNKQLDHIQSQVDKIVDWMVGK